MFTYILRGISVMLAVLYTVSGLCVRSVPSVETGTNAVMPVEGIPQEHEEISVQILQNREEIGFLLQKALDLYSDKNVNNISFSVRTITTESDYHTALRAELLSNGSADLFQISGAREYFELENHVRALDSNAWIMSSREGSLDAVSHNDHVYGIPYSIEAVGLICNRYAFEAAEISPETIRSLSDLDDAFAKIKEEIASGESELLIGMEHVTELAAYDKAFLGTKLADIVTSGAFSTSTEAALAKSVDFPASEQSEEFIKIMAKYSQSRSDWTKLVQITDAQQIEGLANGRVAVILHDTGVYKRLIGLNPEIRGRTLLLPIPLDIFEQPSIYAGVPSYWAVNAAASDKTAAAATGFLEWLYTSDEGSELFANEFGEVSAFRGTAKITGVLLHSQMLSYLSADMYMPQINREYPANWGKNIFATNVQDYFIEREKTWDEVVSACKEGWPD